ncbi:MAG: MTH1187 family thiamine-binding protein [Thermodesulfobacteriota bacterium]
MALMQITIIPLGTGTPSVGGYVADVERFLRDRGIEHQLQDMGTVVHGEADDLFRLAGQIHNLTFAKGVKRVVTQLTIDDRRDITRRIGDKQGAVQERLAMEKK